MYHDKWNAKAYAKYSKGQQKWAKELIQTLDLCGDEDILDLGCADGKITAKLFEMTSGKVIGIDKSESMIRLAREKFPQISFQVADAAHLAFDKTFDVVFSNAMLHWVHDHIGVLEGIYKALKPKGRILLQFGGYGNAKKILHIMNEVKLQRRYKRYFENFEFPYFFPSDKQYETLLKDAGFDDIFVALVPKDMVHDSVEAFKWWIRTTWFPYIDMLPEEMREEFIERFTERYLDVVAPDSDARVHVDMVRIEVRATRS